ncbi:MAG TPA: hypothetical protein VMX14_02050 [Anaerolineae bacterium]|nr:hypothetical protein [Anaerolineae bacterium]
MEKLDYNSPSVQSSLTILQDVITRMAGNSASAKTWCVALVSAILVLLADRGSPALVWMALAPILLFCMLDTYYLALEKDFRDRYNELVRKLHAGEAALHDLFVVLPPGESPLTLRNTSRAFKSFSVWPFYTIQVVILLAVWFLLFSAITPPA